MHAAEEMEESGDGDSQVESEDATEVVVPQRWLKWKSGTAVVFLQLGLEANLKSESSGCLVEPQSSQLSNP